MQQLIEMNVKPIDARQMVASYAQWRCVYDAGQLSSFSSGGGTGSQPAGVQLLTDSTSSSQEM